MTWAKLFHGEPSGRVSGAIFNGNKWASFNALIAFVCETLLRYGKRGTDLFALYVVKTCVTYV